MAPTIRTGLADDFPAVLGLWIGGKAEPTHTDDVASLRALVDHQGSTLLVAEDDGAVIGSVIAGWDGWRGSVYRLVVAPGHRREGLGRQLLEAAESHLRSVGAARLQAIVVETESLATAFWRASGWDQQRHRLRFTLG